MTASLEHFEEMFDFFERASREEVGLELEFESPEAMRLYRAKLYQVRRELGGYANLSFVDRDNKLWIVKRHETET